MITKEQFLQKVMEYGKANQKKEEFDNNLYPYLEKALKITSDSRELPSVLEDYNNGEEWVVDDWWDDVRKLASKMRRMNRTEYIENITMTLKCNENELPYKKRKVRYYIPYVVLKVVTNKGRKFEWDLTSCNDVKICDESFQKIADTINMALCMGYSPQDLNIKEVNEEYDFFYDMDDIERYVASAIGEVA